MTLDDIDLTPSEGDAWAAAIGSLTAERDAAIARAEAAEAALMAARDAIVGLRPHVPLSYALPVDGVTTSVPSLKAAWAAADTVLATIGALAPAGKEPADG